MGNITIVTDSACNLTLDYIKENNIILLPFSININGTNYRDIIDLNVTKFYEVINNKDNTIKTLGIKEDEFRVIFRRELDLGNEVLYIGVSSGLSSTYTFAEVAKDEFNKKKIALVDSKTASFAQGILVKEAVKLVNKRYSLRDIKDHLNILKEKLDYSIMISNIEVLKNSNSITETKSFENEFSNIIPIITVDKGKVKILKKVKNKKGAVRFLLKRLNAFEVNEDYSIIICYGTDIELKNNVENKLKEFKFKCPIESVQVGASIGSYIGKSCIGLLFVRN